jgi:hypothetical protein
MVAAVRTYDWLLSKYIGLEIKEKYKVTLERTWRLCSYHEPWGEMFVPKFNF